MKKTINLLSMILGLVLAGAPAFALADTQPFIPVEAPILITEVQAGSSASASEEFIELYNTTSQPIDVSAGNWQLQIASSTATIWDSPLRTIALSGIIASGQHYVVASQFTSSGQTVQYLPLTATQWFSAGISAAAGHVRLVRSVDLLQPDNSCLATNVVDDQLEWSTPQGSGAATPSITGRSLFVTPKTSGVPAGSSLQRLIDPVSHFYIDTNNDATDFALNASPSPANANTGVATASPADNAWQIAPVFTASQLCNAETPPPSGGNGGDQTVSPLQPPADSPPTVDPTTAGGSLATTTDSGNQTPPAVPTIPLADQGLLGPQISEILPNPASPKTDVDDEFIELYNPNDAPFDLSNFVLEAGLGTVHTYTFPVGTMLAPKRFTAFFSADTKLSLSNSGGRVSLLDPLGSLIVQSGPYGAAKDGQTWVLIGGVWQWTDIPTPSGANILHAPITVATAKKAAAPSNTAAKKTAAVKAATTKRATVAKTKSSSHKANSAAQTTAAVTPDTPLHVSILAVAVVLAVLYGAYEYRTDLANRIHQLRGHREARREARASLKGRRSD